MRRTTKSQMYGFRLNKKYEPTFLKYLDEQNLTASECARDAIQSLLRSTYENENQRAISS